MLTPLCNSIKTVAFTLSLLLIGFTGCESKDSPQRTRAKNYLIKHSSPTHSSNAWSNDIYQEMLTKLNQSVEPNVLLRHERVGNSLTIYWFDEAVSSHDFSIVFADGTLTIHNPSEYRGTNEESRRSGEPQYYFVPNVWESERGVPRELRWLDKSFSLSEAEE